MLHGTASLPAIANSGHETMLTLRSIDLSDFAVFEGKQRIETGQVVLVITRERPKRLIGGQAGIFVQNASTRSLRQPAGALRAGKSDRNAFAMRDCREFRV